MCFHTPKENPFENIVGKGENAGDQQHFPFFPQCFLYPMKEELNV